MAIEKKSAHLVDPELKSLVEETQGFELTNETLALHRKEMEAEENTSVPPNLPVDVEEKLVPGPGGAPDVRVIIITPTDAPAPRPGYLDIHGGGMILGSADGNNAANASLAAELGCTVVSVDYRLAPETRHPGPVEDCYAALKWMHDHARELDVDQKKMAIGGGSAGGGLAAALAVLARDRGEVNILFQALLSPMLDDRTCVADPNPYAGEYVWTPESNRFGWRSLLGRDPGGEGVSPYASAPRAEDLSGLPPTFINIGSIDLFVDESIDYAKRLIRSGVPTELHVYPGVYHGGGIVSEARVSKAMNRDRLEAVRRAFFG